MKTIPLFNFTVFILIFGFVIGKILMQLFGLPNITSYIRDFSILVLFINFIVTQKHTFKLSTSIFAALFALFFCFTYLITSFEQGKIIIGLYYLRIYVLPMIFFVVAWKIVCRFDTNRLKIFLLTILRWNLTANLLSILIYTLLLSVPSFALLFLGKEEVASNWRIAGANIYRAGFPQGDPNQLGLYQAINICLMFFIMLKKIDVGIRPAFIKILLLLDVIILFLSFSRSSMVFLITCVCVILMFRFSRIVKSVLLYSLVLLLVLISSALVTNKVTDGKLTTWIMMNITMDDPSIGGHTNTIYDAVQAVDQYILFGYERGTVGPKAELFTDTIINVENSVLILLFDMGIFGLLIYITIYGLLILPFVRNIYQTALLVAFIVNIQFLPSIFSIEIVMYFFAVFVITANFLKLENNHFPKAIS